MPQTKTVELDSDLAERAQREADKRGITLKQLVNDALERKLTKEEEALRNQRRQPRLGQGRSTDGLSAANIAVDPVSLPGPSSRAAPPRMTDVGKPADPEVERQRIAANRLRGLFADVAPGRSLVDELIAERRAEVRAEDREAKTVDVVVGVAEDRQPGPILSHAMDELQKIRDRQGRDVLLSPERWRHIVNGHPEIEVYEQEIRRAVESPTAVLSGREPGEEWLYLEGAGPSRWLKVVVAFDSAERGRIITAFARRRKP